MCGLSVDEAKTPGLPRVTVGIPVYNGENYLAEAIDSILAQSFGDFELLISDNASTDRTEAICREFASRDPRIVYFRQPENLGAAHNYNFVFHNSHGEYFKWAAHDDLVDPQFLELAVAALDLHPEVPLVFSKTRKIDEHGKVVGTYGETYEQMRLSSPRPAERFGDMVCMPNNCVALFGLMRKSQLATTNLHAAYPGADRCLLGELALRGPVYEIPEYLFLRRDHPGAYTHQQNRTRYRMGWWDPSQQDRRSFPHWRRLKELRGSIERANLPLAQRLACYGQLVRWLFAPKWYRQHWFKLIEDVVWAASLSIRGARKNANDSGPQRPNQLSQAE